MLTDINGSKQSEAVVVVDNAFFRYNKKTAILDGLSLRANKGQILALLGPTGVGKTTLIRVILGRIRLINGSVAVFGRCPGTPESNIPGPGVGYMPQELALFEEFTVKEILSYYGLIYHMNDDEVNKRIIDLSSMLNLPEGSRPISTFSGGQKRRVSVAVAMIHRPKLVILDEPTVGVDPLLRVKIWEYLKLLSDEFGQTTIITTHYIEEARRADSVAFMNYGRILESGHPDDLLLRHDCNTLEDIFLNLCRRSDLKATERTDPDVSETKKNKKLKPRSTNVFHQFAIDSKRLKAMNMKYRNESLRRPVNLVVYFCLIPLLLLLVRYTMQNPRLDVPIAVYNGDAGSDLSQLFLDSLDPKYLRVNEFADNETAFNSVVNAKNWVSLVIPNNFSDNFETRIRYPLEISDEELESTQIKLWLDGTDISAQLVVYQNIYSSLMKFFDKSGQLLVGHNLSDYFNLLSEERINGDLEFNYGKLMAAGVVINNLIFLAMIHSAFQVLLDKTSSSFERLLVAGVTPFEYFVAQIANNFILNALSVPVIMFFTFYVFDHSLKGSLIEVAALLFMIGVEGTAFGIILGTINNSAINLSLFVFAFCSSLFVVSGVMWPIESLPSFLASVCRLLPITYPVDAMKAIMFSGRSITSALVFNGFLTCFIYSLASLSISYTVMKILFN